MRAECREQVQVWSETGRPARMVWRQERWRVIDRPTRHDGGQLFEAWRFVARSERDHRTVIADVERVGDEWSLVATYE